MKRTIISCSGRLFRAVPGLLAVALFSLAVIEVGCARGPAFEEPARGESILDRVVHIEPTLITSIPDVPRWCDRIAALEKRRIDVGDAELYVELEGRGTPLVLISGGPGGTHHYFHPWFSRAAKFARVVYYDQRGCGLSDYAPGPDGYSVEQAVTDLEALRRALGFEKWVVLGYSYGGFLAQLYTIHHPDRVSGLVLVGAEPGMSIDVGPTRQQEFISDAERERMRELRGELGDYAREKGLTREQVGRLSLFNNFINGDWKRQNFFKLSPGRIAQIARYEWVHDRDFNSIMGRSCRRWDLTGAFEGNPTPTLILEGRYDLTWSEKKRDILKANHPASRVRMVVFENAGHGIYDEQPGEFFRVLKDFLGDLPEPGEAELAAFRDHLEGWLARMKARPELAIESLGSGMTASRKLAADFSPEWLESMSSWWQFMRMALAFYDLERYADAMHLFKLLESRFSGEPAIKAVALIWQGHLLDLTGRRCEALERYRIAADMDIAQSFMHSQYGMRYAISPYARERLKTPFARIENTER